MFVMKSNLEDRLNISTKVNPTTYDDYRYGQMKRGRGAERGGGQVREHYFGGKEGGGTGTRRLTMRSWGYRYGKMT